MAVYIRKVVKLCALPANVRNLEIAGIQIPDVQLFAVYNRPQAFVTNKDLQILTNHNRPVLVGDFKVKHTVLLKQTETTDHKNRPITKNRICIRHNC